MGDSSSASAESYSKKLAILNQDFTVGHVSLQEYESTKKTLEAELLKAQLQEQQVGQQKATRYATK